MAILAIPAKSIRFHRRLGLLFACEALGQAGATVENSVTTT
jgi:hypothetical protein